MNRRQQNTRTKQADPTGRLDIAAMRIAEEVAKAICPREWPELRPVVAHYANMLKPGRPGSATSIIQTAIRTATKRPHV